MKRILSLLFLLPFCFIYGQSLSFRQYKVEDGLSHNTVISMLQDHRGFMWFGTKDGLNRFDGYNYKIFQHQTGDTTSIGSNFIRCLHEYENVLWVGTDTGLFEYNEQTESFTLIESTKDQPILDITNDEEGNLWFSAAGELHRRSLKTVTKDEEVFKQFYASFISSSPSGDIFVSSSSALYRFVADNHSFQRVNLNYDDEVIITEINASLDQDTIYIGTKNNGALVYDIPRNQTELLLREAENPLFVRGFLKKNESELWVASESGIFIYDVQQGTYRNYKKNYNNPYSLSDNAIYSLVQDKEGGVWIATYFGGVNYFQKQFTPFSRYFPRVGENSISGNAVREIQKDQYGYLWIGTEDAGLNRLDPKTGKFDNYASVRNKGKISHYNIHGLLARENELWIGTFEHGLDIMNIQTGAMIRHFGTGEYGGGLRSNFILYIYETANKDLYVLTSSGIHRYLEAQQSFEVVKGFPEMYHYTYLLEDKDGILWAGTYWDGLYYYNPKSGEKGFFKYDRHDPKSLSSNVINGIFQDSKDRLWITTENGLNLYDPVKKEFQRISREDGFPSNVTYSILEDKDHDLWISTSSGIVEYNPDDEKLNIYTKSNGLLSNQFNYSSGFRDESGEMYFGSVNGMISFNPEEFIKNDYHPPIYINDLQIDNKEVNVHDVNSPLSQSLSFEEGITLNPAQSTFSLEFASLTYTAPEMTKYWYKLEGLNDNWIPVGKSHRVSFTELPAGDYVFKVKALNNHGVWSNESKALNIEILPPMLASKTAYFIYACLFLVLVYFLLRYYHRYNKNKHNRKIRQLESQKEKEIYQAKIEFFTNIAHEIRTPLTLIKSPLEKLLKNSYKSPEIPKNLGIMDKNTSRLLNLVNELLDFRKTEMKNVRLTFIKVNITEMLQDTYIRFSQLIQEKDLEFNIKRPREDVYAYVDEEAIRKILSNLFSNAVKYSHSLIEVELIQRECEFSIIVKNDGKLISPDLKHRIFEPFYRIPDEDDSATGSGIGLSLSHSLAELHNGNLSIEFNDKRMNTFLLTMPIHQEDEFRTINSETYTRREGQEIEKVGFDKSAPIILIAEDNDELAEFIATEMAVFYKVVKAKNGLEAVRCIEEFDVQLVISDVMMPAKNGIELCKQIKGDVKTNHIPVILLTAKNALSAKIEGLESGADAYISKPFSMEHLQVQVSNLLENRRSILGHYSNSPLAHLKSISFSEADKSFLSRLDQVIDEHMRDPELNVESLASRMNMSRATLYRKIKEISDMSPNELINTSRLKKAAFLLKTTDMKVYEVSEEVGYRSQTSFGRNFHKQYNMTPSEFMD
ncbi:hybrid sensor histidine kinase/response regulator transcription factor [Robertkochia solimangrovi]|uniref:hybrid sensor histidine kinase/response regulator transcription factor n=1 Tax=Robertkochia solimangrovi TaxID=2213046 RepID=UPI00117F321C|nr:hybrid sensor histidine kinase/response regulator transcription factor [Robertkochia solimangrovi]TRZ42941.1 hybrid sensor histidine kinase/response regulator [Robertkochia solimangrovi]